MMMSNYPFFLALFILMWRTLLTHHMCAHIDTHKEKRMFFTLSARTGKTKEGENDSLASIDTLLKEIAIDRGVMETFDRGRVEEMRKIHDKVVGMYTTIIDKYNEANEALGENEIAPLQTAYQMTLKEHIETMREIERLHLVKQDIKRRHLEHLKLIREIDRTAEEEASLGEAWIDEEAAFYNGLNTETKNNGLALDRLNAEVANLKIINAQRESRLAIFIAQREQFVIEQNAIKTQLDEFVLAWRFLSDDEGVLESIQMVSIQIDDEEERSEETKDPRKEKALRILALLRASRYDVLKAEFSAEWQQFFLVTLFALFRVPKNSTTIDPQVPLFIAYLTESHGAYMPFLYETLRSKELSDKQKETRINSYLADLSLPVSLEHTGIKVATLVHEEPRLDRASLLHVIEALLTNAPGIFVIPVATTTTTTTTNSPGTEEEEKKRAEEEKKRVERLKAAVLFRHDDLKGVKQASTLPRIDENAHLFHVKDSRTGRSVAIKIVAYEVGRSEQERYAYELFNTIPLGFERLVNHFRLGHFPSSLFIGDGVALYNPVHVYVTESPGADISMMSMATQEDRRCVLVEMLYALRQVKRQFGAQHNNLRSETIKFNISKKTQSPPLRTYRLDNTEEEEEDEKTLLECQSRYYVVLVHYGFVTIEESMDATQRRLLAGVDYDSVRQILNHPLFLVRDELRRTLHTLIERNKESIAFDTLLRALK
jgi:hypothetical protein